MQKEENKYISYTEDELHVLTNEPWEVSDNPYMLHAAFALSCLKDLCQLDNEDEEEEDEKEIWGDEVPKKMLDRMVFDIKNDFNDAASNYKPIEILGRRYSIRKTNAYDKNRLHLIFDFPVDNGNYIITKTGVINLAKEKIDVTDKYKAAQDEFKRNKIYLRQIIKLAEDDENDGWDKLTDMEIILYCWAQFYNKYQFNNFLKFKEEYKDYFYVNENEIKQCYTDKAILRSGPCGMYTFSYKKVQQWNNINKQKSFASAIPEQEADDYWYDIALKNTFKPIDFK